MMGQSTDGQLTYGTDLGEEIPEELYELLTGEDGYVDFDEFVYRDIGVQEQDEGLAMGDRETGIERDARWAAQKEALENYPVQLIEYCSGECPMYIVAPNVDGLHTYVSRGDTVEIPANLPKPNPEQRSAFDTWCKKYGIEGEPKWLLTSMWD